MGKYAIVDVLSSSKNERIVVLPPEKDTRYSVSNQAAIQAEIKRRQDIWQAIAALIPQAIQAVSTWAVNNGAPKEAVKWWLRQEPTYVTVTTPLYTLQFNFDGRLELLPPLLFLEEPPSAELVEFRQKKQQRYDEDAIYDGLPKLTEDDIMMLWPLACGQFSQDLVHKLNEPGCPGRS